MKKFVGVNLFFIVILSFTIHAMTVFGLDGADVNGQYGKMVTGIRVPETICSIAKGELQKKRENPEGNKGSPQNRWGIQLDEIEQDMIARNHHAGGRRGTGQGTAGCGGGNPEPDVFRPVS